MPLLPRETELLRLHDQFVSDANDDNAISLLSYIDENYDKMDIDNPNYVGFDYLPASDKWDEDTLTSLLEKHPAVAPVSALRSVLIYNDKSIRIGEDAISPLWHTIIEKFISVILV